MALRWEVSIALPGAKQDDAAAFGFWIESCLRYAREDGDLDTEIGEIKLLRIEDSKK